METYSGMIALIQYTTLCIENDCAGTSSLNSAFFCCGYANCMEEYGFPFRLRKGWSTFRLINDERKLSRMNHFVLLKAILHRKPFLFIVTYLSSTQQLYGIKLWRGLLTERDKIICPTQWLIPWTGEEFDLIKQTDASHTDDVHILFAVNNKVVILFNTPLLFYISNNEYLSTISLSSFM